MPKVTFMNEAVTVEAENGKTIKEIADQHGINLFEGFWGKYHCSGTGKCLGSGCRVWVTERAPNAVNGRTMWEKIRPTLTDGIRLACQVQCGGEIEVRTQPGALLDVPQNGKWEPDKRHFKWQDRLKPGSGGGDDEEDAAAE